MQKSKFVLMCVAAACSVSAHTVMAADDDEALMKWLRRSNAVYSPHEAALFGKDAEDMSRAVKAAPQHVNIVDEQGNSPLHLAVMGGNAGMVEVLLEAGADACMKNAQCQLPIELATNDDIVAMLKKAAVAREAELQLCSAVQQGDAQAVRAALAAGVSPNAQVAGSPGTVLSVAVQNNKADIVEMLLAAGAGTELAHPNGKSLLHLAAERSSAAVVRALIKAGVDPMKPDVQGATPLHDAVWAKNTAAVQELLPAYAEVNFSPQGRHLGTPIEMAIAHSRADYVQMFLNAGIDVNGRMFRKNPLLHTAARMDKVFIVKMLLDAGADKNAVDAEGKRAVEYAKGEAAELLK